MAVVRHKEAIHSGHFMISDFEAEAEDEEDLAVPPPEEGSNIPLPRLITAEEEDDGEEVGIPPVPLPEEKFDPMQHLKVGKDGKCETVIDLSLNKLFRSMSIAYTQKLTSPKWNRFRGLKLRWKDKIRLNNVIWRCWHIQFIKGSNRLMCAFANPLEIDNHNRTEGGTLLEGKYWKRKLKTVTKQYMKWRMFYKGRGNENDEEITDQQWDLIFQSPFQVMEGSKDDAALDLMGPDDDFLMDALFSTFNGDAGGKSPGSSVAGIQFPNPREISKATTNADFIQPGLVQLQPNLDDFFTDLDSQPDWLLSKLPTIQESPEEGSSQQFSVQHPVPRQGQMPSKGKVLPGSSDGQYPVQQVPGLPSDRSRVQTGQSIKYQPPSVQPEPANAQLLPPPGTEISQYLQVPQQIAPNQQGQQGQGTVMDLAAAAMAVQEQRQQQQPRHPQQENTAGVSSNSLFPPFAPDLEKKSPPQAHPQPHPHPSSTCVSQKRHSPKHRILHKEYYTDSSTRTELASMAKTASFPLPGEKMATAILSAQYATPPNRAAPMPPPPSEAAAIATDQYPVSSRHVETPPPPQHQRSIECATSSRSRSLSGPSYAGMKRTNSELVHLLKSSKVTKLEQQQSFHHKAPHYFAERKPPLNSHVQLEGAEINSPRIELSQHQYGKSPREERFVLPDGIKTEFQSLTPRSSLTGQPFPGRSNEHLPARRSLSTLGAHPIPPVPQRDQPPQGMVPRQRQTYTEKGQSEGDWRKRGRGREREQQQPTSSTSSGPSAAGKNGFDLLRSLIPSLNQQSSSVKISKAALLHKGGDYLRQLVSERAMLKEELESHRRKIDALNDSLRELHKSLSTSGGGGCRGGFTTDTFQELEQMFDGHVFCCTNQNWKYWPFSLMMHPLLRSFQATVDSSSYDELARTFGNWLDQHLVLTKLRPSTVGSLTELSRRSDLVERGNCDELPDLALAEAARGSKTTIQRLSE